MCGVGVKEKGKRTEATWAGKELPGSRKGRQEVAGDALQGGANLWKKQSFDARQSRRTGACVSVTVTDQCRRD